LGRNYAEGKRRIAGGKGNIPGGEEKLRGDRKKPKIKNHARRWAWWLVIG
jgi:hypothetical protein